MNLQKALHEVAANSPPNIAIAFLALARQLDQQEEEEAKFFDDLYNDVFPDQ